MKISELEQKIEDVARDTVLQTVEEKADDLVKGIVDKYLKDQLKEQIQDTVDKVKAQFPVDTPELKAAKDKANQFPSFGSFLTAIYSARNGRGIDSKLTFLNSKGEIKKVPGPAVEVDANGKAVGTIEDGIAGKVAGRMEIGDDSQGGFLVPEIFSADLQMWQLENSVVRPNGATVLTMTTDSLKIPYINDTTHVTTVFGGINAAWTAEAAEKTATKPTFGQMEFTPHKLAGITYSSDELLADSAIALAQLITRLFGSAHGYFEDDAFLVGTGAGRPLGIQNCNATINNFRETVNRVKIKDLSEMWMRLIPSSQGTAVWVINPTVIPELLELGSGNAADASGKNLVYISNVPDTPPMSIWGRPVIVSEKMQALGTAGDIGLYDFRHYLIGDRQPLTIDSSSHVAFTTDETCWRFVIRVAGMCWPQAPLTMRRGGTTQSPFVQLAAATS